MCESGIDLGFDLLEEGFQVEDYSSSFYELKSHPLERYVFPVFHSLLVKFPLDLGTVVL